MALCGIFPLAGFWSKDEILGAAMDNGSLGMSAKLLWGLGTLVAFMTAFYMGRAWFMTFRGEYRGHHEPHESPKVMTVPLWILAIFSIFVGFVGVPGKTATSSSNSCIDWHVGGPAQFHMSVALISTDGGSAGFGVGVSSIYGKGTGEDPLPEKPGGPVDHCGPTSGTSTGSTSGSCASCNRALPSCAGGSSAGLSFRACSTATARGSRVAGEAGAAGVHTGRLGSYVTSFVLGAVLILIDRR